MPLHVRNPPQRASEILNEGLESLLSTPNSSLRTWHEAGDPHATQLDAASPHLVYFVGLNDLVEGRILSAAQPTSWRYILLDQENVHAAAEVAIDAAGEVVGFSHLDRGPFVESTIAGIDFAERLEASLGVDYELRLLSAPSVYFVGLWLHGADDLLVPLAPAPRGLEPEHAYTEDEMVIALTELIEQRKINQDPIP
jgi:hypothetical protein